MVTHCAGPPMNLLSGLDAATPFESWICWRPMERYSRDESHMKKDRLLRPLADSITYFDRFGGSTRTAFFEYQWRDDKQVVNSVQRNLQTEDGGVSLQDTLQCQERTKSTMGGSIRSSGKRSFPDAREKTSLPRLIGLFQSMMVESAGETPPAWTNNFSCMSETPKPYRLPRHRILKCFPRNSLKTSGKSQIINESSDGRDECEIWSAE